MSQGPGIVVSFNRLAGREYLAARRWYARRSPATAQRFQDAIDDAVRWIAASPQAGSPFRGRFRWVRVARFPYLLYYEVVDPTHVVVWAVSHQRRRPGYWQRRAPP
jgi:plasmid stabilization system protein ParE